MCETSGKLHMFDMANINTTVFEIAGGGGWLVKVSWA